MPIYNAPIRELRFVLNELLVITDCKEIPGYGEVNDDLVDAILEGGARVTEEIWLPLNQVGDEEGCQFENGVVRTPSGFKEAFRAFYEGGWNAISSSPDWGGQGLPDVLGMAIGEMALSSNLSLSTYMGLTGGAASVIQSVAPDHLKQIYVPKMMSGEWTGTMNLTEPQAGSDLSVLNTSAAQSGDHYKINGQKIFITWGEHDLSENIIHLVLARLPDAPEGVKGISLFLVPKYLVKDDGSLGERNNHHAVSIEHKLGIHGCATCVMSFEDATGYLVGEVNEGLSCMFTMMNDARIGVACESVAIAERSYQQALSYSKERVQGRSNDQSQRVSIIHHPDVRRMLLKMRSQIEVMRILVYLNTLELDLAANNEQHSLRADLLTPITKGWCSELCQEITSIGLQIHGGMGYVEETGAAQHFRDSRITTIYEGTTGIQANDLIGRKVIRDNGAELNQFISEISSEIDAIDSDQANLANIKKSMQEALSVVEDSVNYILDSQTDDPFLAGSASYNFLMLMGTFTGGWIACRSALLSLKNIHDGNDREFYKGKLVSSNFFIEQCLPMIHFYSKALMSGSKTTMALSEDQF